MKFQRDLLALLGAVVGGILGYFVFVWLVQQGLYAMVVPGGLVGIVAGLARPTHFATAIICGVLALIVSLFTEWQVFPFAADESLSFFLSHLFDKAPMKLLMIAAGTAIGFWIPFRRSQESTK